MSKKRWYIFIIIIIFMVLLTPRSIAHAESISEDTDVPYSIETTISESGISLNTYSTVSTSSTKKITKTKTAKSKSKDGTTLWFVSVTATFTYDGTTSKCISCSHSAVSYAKTWTIKSVSSKKSGNSATATAVATHTFDKASKDFTQSVTITCSKNGFVS